MWIGFKNKGVQPLLNGVIDYLPGPLDVAAYTGFSPDDVTETRNIERRANDAEPFSGLAFKIMNDPFVGSLTFVRIYSGVLKKGDSLLNSTKGKRERVGRMMMMHSNNREEIEEAFAGDIVALAGMKDSTTGNTLCDPLKPVVLETMTFPIRSSRLRLSQRQRMTRKKWVQALHVWLLKIHLSRSALTLNQARPLCVVWVNCTSISWSIASSVNLRLRPILARRRLRIARPSPKKLKLITPTRSSLVVQVSSHGLKSGLRLWLRRFPVQQFSCWWIGSKRICPGVEKGINQAKDSGTIAGFPVIDFEAELVDGASHDVDSSVLAFEIAGRAAFREAMNKASPKLLEPVMKVEVLTPEEYMGDIIGDLNSRRGNVGGMNQRGNARAIDAMVPLANMFGYINTLRSMSQGRAQYSMTFDHYEQVPQAVADEVRAKMA
jgi:elongation factor G